MNAFLNNIIKNGLFLLTLSVVSACNTITQEAEDEQSAAELNAVNLSWQNRSTAEMTKRVSMLAELLGVNANKEHLTEMLSDQGSLGDWQTLRDEKSALMFKVLSDYDEIRLVNTGIAENTEGLKLEEQQAIEIAADILGALNKNELLNGLQYHPEKYKVGYHRVASGSIDGKYIEDTIVGYRITFLAYIEDIPMANAGVRVAVHRSGKLSGIRIGGVSASKGAEKVLSRKVSDDEIRKRFEASVPRGMKPRIAWQRIMYVMPDEERSAVVYPTHTISYSLVGESEQGEVISRRKTVGFSLVDGKADMIDYLKPTTKHQTTELSRDAKQDVSLNRQVKEAESNSH